MSHLLLVQCNVRCMSDVNMTSDVHNYDKRMMSDIVQHTLRATYDLGYDQCTLNSRYDIRRTTSDVSGLKCPT